MKKKYVYYDKDTGQLRDILSKRKRGRAKYIECTIDEVVGFITGEWGMNSWCVAYNQDEKRHMLMEKNNVIKLRKASSELYKIPYRKNTETDITLVFYEDNVLEVSLDVSRIAPLYQTNFREDIQFERGSEIRLVLKEKDSGNLLKEFVIEAQDLLEAGQLFFDLYEWIYQDNVEFFTYKLFPSYSWHKGVIKLMSPIKSRIKFDIHKADMRPTKDDFSYHLIMQSTEKGLKVVNNIENLKLIRFNNQIEFFVVDPHDPNILYEKFVLTEDDLQSKHLSVKLEADTSGKAILYNHKHISVLKEG